MNHYLEQFFANRAINDTTMPEQYSLLFCCFSSQLWVLFAIGNNISRPLHVFQLIFQQETVPLLHFSHYIPLCNICNAYPLESPNCCKTFLLENVLKFYYFRTKNLIAIQINFIYIYTWENWKILKTLSIYF